MTTTILVTSLSAFWVETDSAWAFAACGAEENVQQREQMQSSCNDLETQRITPLRHAAYRFQREKQLRVAENDGKEGDREAEAEEEHHVGLIVELVVGCVPVRSTGALHALWDVPGETVNVGDT